MHFTFCFDSAIRFFNESTIQLIQQLKAHQWLGRKIWQQLVAISCLIEERLFSYDFLCVWKCIVRDLWLQISAVSRNLKIPEKCGFFNNNPV